MKSTKTSDSAWWKNVFRRLLTIGLSALLLPVGSLAAQTAPTKVTYYYTDPQGTVLATADEAGSVTATSDYRPYGAQALGTPEAAPGYTGHVNDPDSGLVYMQARYYDSASGRFMSVDPNGIRSGNLAGFGRYTYAVNNPIGNIDPNGREAACVSQSSHCSGIGVGISALPGKVADGLQAVNDQIVEPAMMINPAAFGETSAVIGEVSGGLRLLGGAEKLGLAVGGSEVPAAIGATGKIGENTLKLLGGESQAYFSTSRGPRYVDQLVENFAHESKVGYTPLTAAVSRQVSKDVELMQTGAIDGAVWHFFTSPVTGLGGPSKPLYSLLEKSNIEVVTHQ